MKRKCETKGCRRKRVYKIAWPQVTVDEAGFWIDTLITTRCSRHATAFLDPVKGPVVRGLLTVWPYSPDEVDQFIKDHHLPINMLVYRRNLKRGKPQWR